MQFAFAPRSSARCGWPKAATHYRSAAIFDLPPALAEARRREPVVKFAPETGLGRVVKIKEVVHVRDMSQDPAYLAGNPRAVLLVDLGGARTIMQFSCRWSRTTRVTRCAHRHLPSGSAALHRQADRARQELLPAKPLSPLRIRACSTSCANCSNSRLLPPMCSRSLAAQCSTYSSCSTRWCSRLPSCARQTSPLSDDRSAMHIRWQQPTVCLPQQREHHQLYSNRPDRGSAYGRALIEGRTVHIPDVLADPEFNRPQASGAIGVRTAVGVPLMREGTAIGVLILLRRQPRLFTQKAD